MSMRRDALYDEQGREVVTPSAYDALRSAGASVAHEPRRRRSRTTLDQTVDEKDLGSSIGRIRAVIGSREGFDPDAVNGDPRNDQTVQDGTPWERPATPLRRAVEAVRTRVQERRSRRVAERVQADRPSRRVARRAAAVERALSPEQDFSSSGLRRLLNQLGPALRESETTPEDLVNHFALIRNRVERKHGQIRTAKDAKMVLRKVLPNLIDSPDTMPSFTNPDGELTARERGWVHTLVHHADRHPEAAKWIIQLDYSPNNTRWKTHDKARGYVSTSFVRDEGNRRAYGFGLVYGINGKVQTDLPDVNHNVGSSAVREMVESNANEDVVQEIRAMLTAQHEWGHVLHDDRILRHIGHTPDDSPVDRATAVWKSFTDREKAAAWGAQDLAFQLKLFNLERKKNKQSTIPEQLVEALTHAKYRTMALEPDDIKWDQAMEFLDIHLEKLFDEEGIDVQDLLDRADMFEMDMAQMLLMTNGNEQALIRRLQIGSSRDSAEVARMKLYSHLIGANIAYTYGLYSMDELSREDGTDARKDLGRLSLYAASDPFGREGVAEGFSGRSLGLRSKNRHVNYLFDDWMKVPQMQEEKTAKRKTTPIPPDFGFPLAFDKDGVPFILSCAPEPPVASPSARSRRSTSSKDSTVLRSPNEKGLGPHIGGGDGPLPDAEYDGDGDFRVNDGQPNERAALPDEVQKAVENATKIVEGDGVEQLMVDPVPEFAKVLPRAQEVDYHAIRAREPAFRRELADILRDAPDGIDTQPGVREAFDAFIKEVDAQYERLQKILKDMGVKLEFIMDDPYADVAEMEHDLRVNKRFKVLMTKATGSHSLMSDEQNDRLRAVHDAFGHLGTGRGFDRHGEEAAYQAHRTMFSPLAQRVLAAEFRAQTAYLIEYKAFLEEQKATIMPARYVKMSRLWVQVKAISARSIGQRVTKNPVRITADDDNLYKVGKSHHVSSGRHFRPGSAKA